VDESYTLSVSSQGECRINANTTWGALRALETFSQSVKGDDDGGDGVVVESSYFIVDSPRFPHRFQYRIILTISMNMCMCVCVRGVLIDSARHYLPIEMVYQVVRSMEYSKLNVLHWHLV